jgi:hypothetical protein
VQRGGLVAELGVVPADALAVFGDGGACVVAELGELADQALLASGFTRLANCLASLVYTIIWH